jgi:hypothetical protein
MAAKETTMRNTVKGFWILSLLILTAGRIATARAASSDDHGSVVVVFNDGHRQNLDIADIARINFKAPAMIVFKDGQRQSIPAADVESIEFENTAGASVPGRGHFVGKWKVGEGNGSSFYITLERDGAARKSIGPPHGTWTVVSGDARITWDDGWHDAIRKVGAKYEKFAYGPGKSFDDPPSNVTAAVNTEPNPI